MNSSAEIMVKPGSDFAKQQVKDCENQSVAKQLAETIFGYMETGKVYEVVLNGQQVTFSRAAVRRRNSLIEKAASADELLISVYKKEKKQRCNHLLTRHLEGNYKKWSITTPLPSRSTWLPLINTEIEEAHLLLLLLCADKLWAQLDVRENNQLRALGKLGISVDSEAIDKAVIAQTKYLESLSG